MQRLLLVVLLALALPAAALADPRQVKPDRAAIGALLDKFVPAVVAGKDMRLGKSLVAGDATTYVQRYPARGSSFHGFLVDYSYPGDVGFDLLLQPTKEKADLGAWSFRGEAKKIDGVWKIVSWYPVATFAPAGRTQTVLGPNDLGPADGASAAGAANGRLGSWVLLTPVLGLALLGLGVASVVGSKWLKRRNRVRELQRALAR
jgi:hypothetical protein